MPALFRRPWLDPRIVPTLGQVEIDPAHPLAPLCCYVPGASFQALGIGPALALSGAGIIGSGSEGPGYQGTVAGEYLSGIAPVPLQIGSGSLVWRGLVLGAPNPSASNPVPFGLVTNPSLPAYAYQYAFNVGSTAWYLFINGLSTNNVFLTWGGSSSGLHTLVAAWTVGGTASVWDNGVLVASGTYTGTPYYPGNSSILLGGDNYSNGARSANALTTFAAIYSTVLNAQQAAQLAAEPFGMLRYKQRRTWVSVPSGGIITGTGAASLGAVTASATASFTMFGTGAALLGSLTAAGAGTAVNYATGSPDLAALLAAGTSNATTTAAGAALLAGILASGTGSSVQPATGAAAFGGLTASGTAMLVNIGFGAPTLGVLSGIGAATAVNAGSGAATFGALTASTGAVYAATMIRSFATDIRYGTLATDIRYGTLATDIRYGTLPN